MKISKITIIAILSLSITNSASAQIIKDVETKLQAFRSAVLIKNSKKKFAAMGKALKDLKYPNGLVNKSGASLEMQMAFEGNNQALVNLKYYAAIKKLPAQKIFRDKNGNTALNYAIFRQHMHTVSMLIKDKKYKLNDTIAPALVSACYTTSKPSLFKDLLSLGANVNSPLKESMTTPLMACAASEQSNIRVLKLLLNNGADPNMRNTKGVKASKLASGKVKRSFLLKAETSKEYSDIRDFLSFKDIKKYKTKETKEVSHFIKGYLADKCKNPNIRHHCQVFSNFYGAKAKTAYAKIGLGNLYSHIKAAKRKNSKYVPSFDSKAIKKLELHNIAHPYIFAITPSCTKAYSSLSSQAPNAPSYDYETRQSMISFLNSVTTPKSCGKGRGFVVYALAKLEGSNSLDIWLVNEKKEIKQIKSGLPHLVF